MYLTDCLLSVAVACATARLKYMLAGLISGTGPGTNPGGDDAKVCQANPSTYIRYRINPGQSTVTKQYKFGTGVIWEGNRRSGVALAIRHRQYIGYHLLTAL